jgi:hypothetical protein
LGGLLISGVYAYPLLGPTQALERDLPVDEGKQRIVLASGHVYSRMDLGPSLTHEDMSGPNVLAAEPFDT